VALLNFKEILELIDKVSDSGLGAVEIETSGVRLRIEGKPSEQVIVREMAPSAPAQLTMQSPQPASTAAALTAEPAKPAEDVDGDLHIITSPIVGTFYAAANPEADPFVRVGDRISKGSVLCIVEAMKLMNEIESDVNGTIARIFPQNGQPIEYGEKLFAVRLG
jgi:acetyl-CoA carboxylase biotin carboxyl carrier protein